MRRGSVNILLALVACAYAQDSIDNMSDEVLSRLADNLFDRVSKAPSLHHADVDDATVGKPRLAMTQKTGLALPLQARPPYAFDGSASSLAGHLSHVLGEATPAQQMQVPSGMRTRETRRDLKVKALEDAGVSVPTVVGGVASIAALAAAVLITDPSKRRQTMADAAGGDEMQSVKNYFNTAGFERWKKIYGETDDVNKVQLDIRQGHAQTVEKVLNWVGNDLDGKTFCDAGCGTGSLNIPLALRGATVYASDISSAMVGEAEKKYEAAVSKGAKPPKVAPVFEAKDLESIQGKYQTVTCLDVMIHYPQDKVSSMISHLGSLAEDRLILSFAPKTLAYSVLKRIGELFPGPSKATRAYLHAEDDVVAALDKAGWEVTRRDMTATSFYFSRLLEAKRKSGAKALPAT